MSAYPTRLREFLADPERSQFALAEAIGRSQAAVNRYANGKRFPDAQTARLIEAATDGAVPFATWQAEAALRIGLSDEHDASDTERVDVSSAGNFPENSPCVAAGRGA